MKRFVQRFFEEMFFKHTDYWRYLPTSFRVQRLKKLVRSCFDPSLIKKGRIEVKNKGKKNQRDLMWFSRIDLCYTKPQLSTFLSFTLNGLIYMRAPFIG